MYRVQHAFCAGGAQLKGTHCHAGHTFELCNVKDIASELPAALGKQSFDSNPNEDIYCRRYNTSSCKGGCGKASPPPTHMPRVQQQQQQRS